jgi:ferrous-iron efflux pump FieF
MEICHARLRRLATYASVAVALTLIVAKLAAYLLSGSVSVLSSLVDSCTDLAASVVTLFSVRHAQRPPDRGHRFGHGKSEALAALAQAAFIAGSGVLLTVEALNRFAHPAPVGQGTVAIAVMLLAIGLTAVLVAFQRRVVTATGSLAIGADRLHYAGDVLLNGAVIAAIVLSQWTGLTLFDPLLGLAIAAFLLRGAWTVAVSALDVLTDHELPQGDRERIKTIVSAHPQVRGLHDLRTRHAGTAAFIELHLELDPDITLAQAHDIADEVERAVAAAFSGAGVFIHQEPAGIRDERLDDRLKTP